MVTQRTSQSDTESCVEDASSDASWEACSTDGSDFWPPHEIEEFSILKLPRELRLHIWNYILLNDEVAALSAEQAKDYAGAKKELRPLRKSITGFYRPFVAMVNMDYDIIRKLNNDEKPGYAIAWWSPLLIASKEVRAEVYEVIMRHIAVELDKRVAFWRTQRWFDKLDNCHKDRMRQLAVFATAKLPDVPDSTWPNHNGGIFAFEVHWPRLYFDHKKISLFKLSLTDSAKCITMACQRRLVKEQHEALFNASTNWASSLPRGHKFTSRDLFVVCDLLQSLVKTFFDEEVWTIVPSQEDLKSASKQEQNVAQRERRTGDRDWSEGWVAVEDKFEAQLVRLEARPTLSKQEDDDDVGLYPSSPLARFSQ